jgi:hypothetical protein
MGAGAVVDVEVRYGERVQARMQRRRRLRHAHLLWVKAAAVRASRLTVAGAQLDLDAAKVRSSSWIDRPKVRVGDGE